MNAQNVMEAIAKGIENALKECVESISDKKIEALIQESNKKLLSSMEELETKITDLEYGVDEEHTKFKTAAQERIERLEELVKCLVVDTKELQGAEEARKDKFKFEDYDTLEAMISTEVSKAVDELKLPTESEVDTIRDDLEGLSNDVSEFKEVAELCITTETLDMQLGESDRLREMRYSIEELEGQIKALKDALIRISQAAAVR